MYYPSGYELSIATDGFPLADFILHSLLFAFDQKAILLSMVNNAFCLWPFNTTLHYEDIYIELLTKPSDRYSVVGIQYVWKSSSID